MIAALGAGLLGVLFVSATPPGIAGQWTGEGWGQIVLTQTAPGEYIGTYTDTVAREKEPGQIKLKWSRIEHRYNGTWSEGEDRFGDISVRLAGDEIRGALTTDLRSRINPATPRLADLLWTRVNGRPVQPLPALCFDGREGSYVSIPNMDMDRLTFATWVKREAMRQRQIMIMSARDGGWGVYFSELPGSSYQGPINDYVWFTHRGAGGWHSDVAVADTQWHFVAVTLGAHLLRFYVDGQPAGKGQMPFALDTIGGRYWLGGATSNDNASDAVLRGCLAETLIFDRALDPEEIARLYDRGRGVHRGMLEGLVAGYHFNEGRGTTAADFSDHGRNGTLHGGVTWVQGKPAAPKTPLPRAGISGALEFHGDRSAYFEVANLTGLPSGMGARTLAAWFKLAKTDVDYGQCIVGYGPNWPGRRFGLFLEPGRIGAEACRRAVWGRWKADTAWHHLAAVVPEHCTQVNQVVVYLDGARLRNPVFEFRDIDTGPNGAQPVATEGSESFDTESGPLRVGLIPGPIWGAMPNGAPLSGAVSEVRIYDRALSAAEIAVLYAQPGQATNRGLVAGYHFDEGRGRTAADFSGHGNDGTLHGGATWGGGKAAGLGPCRHEKVPGAVNPSE